MTSWSKKLQGCFWFLGRDISSGWVSEAAETLSIFWGCVASLNCKPCTHPASIPKKELGVSNWAISGLMDGGSFTSEARFWSHTPMCVADGQQDKVAVFTPSGWGRLPLIGDLTSDWFISYLGNQQRGCPSSPLSVLWNSWSRPSTRGQKNS